MSDIVRLEVADGIGTIVLDRPKMNALDAAMQRRLVEVAEEAAERDDIAAVIVWGGEKVFAAGADVKEMAEMSFTDMSAHVRLLQKFCRA
ncbi:MAG: enoyl-CoA hydratase/isomerase family protein, partial [Janibacter sp.]